jgi:hypothetical protein
MNQRVTSPVLANTRGERLFISLLLPALVIEVAQITAPPLKGYQDSTPLNPWSESRPYLHVIGALPLRFQERAPPPDVSSRPPGGAPPVPSTKATTDIIRMPVSEQSAAATLAAPPAVPVKSEDQHAKSPAANAGSAQTPPAILPDDVGRKVRPEDLLPFFQFPGSSAGADGGNAAGPPAPPSPGTLPPSSATYKQQ